jgi:hypothetical protein
MSYRRPDKYPDRITVSYDYGYRQSIIQQLRGANKFICGYCKGQAKSAQMIQHKVDCPEGEKHALR